MTTTKIRLNLLTPKGQTALLLLPSRDAVRDLAELHVKIQQVCKNKLGLKSVDKFRLVSGAELGLDDLDNNLTICVSSSSTSSSSFDASNIAKRTLQRDPSMISRQCCSSCEIKVIGQEFSNADVVNSLQRFAQMPGVVSVLALPDLSAAIPCPVGTSITVRDRIYPSWIGTDIGCGISLFKLTAKSLSVGGGGGGTTTKLLKRLAAGYTDKWNVADARAFRERFMPSCCASGGGEEEDLLAEHDDTFGSIGAGNHFCELQECHRTGELYLAVHSGSRSLGVDLSARITALVSADAVAEGNGTTKAMAPDTIAKCMRLQNVGIEWAKLNRLAIAKRFVDVLLVHSSASESSRFDSLEDDALDKVLDICHNFIEPAAASSVEEEEEAGSCYYIHRKGAIPTNLGPVLIPGSRGTNSYMVQAAAATTAINSLPHGAGRRYTKADAEKKFSNQASHQAQQSHVLCNDKKLMAQEAPGAYKDIDEIIHLLVSSGYATVLDVFRPVLTVKYIGI